MQPLEHQQQTIEHLEKTLETQNRALIVLPSGAGKTHTIAFHVQKVKPLTFLYVVHRNEILYQSIKVFKDILGITDKDIGIINQHHKQFDARYTFATIQTLFRDKNLEKTHKPDYMVIDEFHHASASSYKKIIQYLKPCKLIGLTATPFRLDNEDIFSLIDNNVANEIDLFTGIQKKILVPFNYIGLWDNIDYTKIEFKGWNYNVGDLDRHLIIAKRDEQVLKEYREIIEPENRLTIAFCNSVTHAWRITELFAKAGIKCMSLTHKDKQEDRLETLRLFRTGHYRVLFTRDILNEGVDFPECEAVMFLRPTISKTIFFQQLGRGLRRRRGKTDVKVLDYIGNYHRAFEKREWLAMFKHGATGEYTKPDYNYDPMCKVWFDSRVIDMMEVQKRNRDNQLATKQDLYEDYIQTCMKESTDQGLPDIKYLSSEDYSRSKYSRFDYDRIYHMYGGWRQFVKENNIPYEFQPPKKPEGFYRYRGKTKQELIDNYYKVKEKWKEYKQQNPGRGTTMPAYWLEDPAISSYDSQTYRRHYGSYRHFLRSLGEIRSDTFDLYLRGNKRKRGTPEWHAAIEPIIKKAVERFQKKYDTKYITYGSWAKEYGAGYGKSYIESLGGFVNFRKKFGIPEHQTFTCSYCKKEFESIYANRRYRITPATCSTQCYRKLVHAPYMRKRRSKIQEEKLAKIIPCLNCGKSIHKHILYKSKEFPYGRLRSRKYCDMKCCNAYNYNKKES